MTIMLHHAIIMSLYSVHDLKLRFFMSTFAFKATNVTKMSQDNHAMEMSVNEYDHDSFFLTFSCMTNFAFFLMSDQSLQT